MLGRAHIGERPVIEPTVVPTVEPTVVPSTEPTVVPSVEPTVVPTPTTSEPTVAPTPTTEAPTVAPTIVPSTEPTVVPSIEPTVAPTPTTEFPTVEVMVDNELIKQEIEEIQGSISKTLQLYLHNNNLKLTVRVAEQKEKIKVLSRKEQFDEIVEKNPALKRLQQVLDLELA